jgi:hypothetical protein
MPDQTIGMGPQDRAERERFESEVHRIVEAGNAGGVTLRLLGSLAFHTHCPKFGHLQEKMGRAYTDIDLAGYSREAPGVRGLMQGLGYSEQKEVFVVSEGGRAIFDNPKIRMHVDVFYEKLDFCHVIPWNGRLEVDSLTIPLAELLLEKMQIVKINEKDIIDTIVLLLEHDLGTHDQDAINVAQIGDLCAQDWGLWRTTTMNLGKVALLCQEYEALSADEQARVVEQVQAILAHVDRQPKSTAWKIRSKVGDRVKWYQDVEETP